MRLSELSDGRTTDVDGFREKMATLYTKSMLPLLLRALRSPDCCILIAYFLSHSKFDGCLDNVRKKNSRRFATRLVGKLSDQKEPILPALNCTQQIGGLTIH